MFNSRQRPHQPRRRRRLLRDSRAGRRHRLHGGHGRRAVPARADQDAGDRHRRTAPERGRQDDRLQDHGRQAAEPVAGRPAPRRRRARTARSWSSCGQRPVPPAKRGEFTGVLAEGSFDAGDFIGPMAARRWPTWSKKSAPATPTSTCTPTTAWTRPTRARATTARRDPRPAEVTPRAGRLQLAIPAPIAYRKPRGTIYWPYRAERRTMPAIQAPSPAPGHHLESTQCR